MLRHRKIGVLVALSLSIWTAVAAAAPNAYITNSGSASILVVDTAGETALTPISLPFGTVPYGVTVSPDGTRLYVTHFAFQGRFLAVETAAPNSILANLPVGMFPFGVAAHPSGNKVYVTVMQNGGKLVVVDATTFGITSVPVGNPRGVAVHPDGSKIYVANYFNDTLTVIDATTLLPIGSPIDVGTSPIGVIVSADGKRVYVTNENPNGVVGTLSVIDTVTNAVIDTVTVGKKPIGVTVTPDNARVYVANSGSGSVSVIDANTNAPDTGDIPVGNIPYGISNDGSQVYVALFGGNKVVVIDRMTNVIVKDFAANQPIAFGQFIRPPSRIDTALTLSVEPMEVIVGSSSPVMLKATLARKDNGATVAGGSIGFSMDNVALGSVSTDASGNAAWSVNPSLLKVGAHQVRIAFAESVIAGTTLSASSASGSFRVVYQWGGWKPPVAGGGTLNPANAGSTISMRWTMMDARGNLISLLEAVVGIDTARMIACAGDGIEEVSAAAGTSGNGVHIDGASQQFQFNWKTDKSWAGQCRAFIVRLRDGTTRMAKFHFR